MRSFKTAVAHYPSTSVATHTATTTTHLRCVTKIAKITKKQSFLGRNGVPHLDGTTRRRTSVASRNRRNNRFQQRNVCYQRRNKSTHLHCVTPKQTKPTHLCCVTTNDAPPLRHETTHLRCVTKRSVRTYKRNGVCTSIATPRTQTPGS